MTDLAELKRLAEAARSANRLSGYDALARACTAATILSLIERLEKAEAKARSGALEEAARKFEAEDHHWGPAIAAAIRALKDNPNAP